MNSFSKQAIKNVSVYHFDDAHFDCRCSFPKRLMIQREVSLMCVCTGSKQAIKKRIRIVW